MSDLEEPVCQVLRKRFHCLCGLKPRYRSCVTNLVNVVRETCEEETENEEQVGRANPAKPCCCGIPDFTDAEKITEVIPVKVQPSVKRAIPEPRSTWTRSVVLEKLECMKE